MGSYAKQIFGAIVLTIMASPLMANTASSMFRLEVPQMETAPEIDGVITQAELNQTVSAPLQKIVSRDNPSHATTVYIGATRQGLYVAFRAEDAAMDSLSGAETDSSGPVPQDDSVQILITPTPEVTVDQYYHFAINPYGVAYGRYIQGAGVVDGWEAKSRKLQDNGAGSWEAEFYIPFKTLRAREGRPTWRANFARFRPARDNEPEETSAWFNPGISLFNYNRFGFLAMPGANWMTNSSDPGTTAAQTTTTAVSTSTIANTAAAPLAADNRTTGMPISTAIVPSTTGQ